MQMKWNMWNNFGISPIFVCSFLVGGLFEAFRVYKKADKRKRINEKNTFISRAQDRELDEFASRTSAKG